MSACGIANCQTHYHACRACDAYTECRTSERDCEWNGYCDDCEAKIAAGLI